MSRRHPFLVLIAAASLTACRADANSASSQKAPLSGEKARPPQRAERPAPVTLPEGTALPLVLKTAVSSSTSKVGDLVVARLESDVRAGERVVLRAGTEVRGVVVKAVRSGRVKGRARLVVSFDRIVVRGREQVVRTGAIDITAPGTAKRDAAIIGGGAGAGVLIGGIAGGKKGAAVGGVVGAGAGTGVVLATKGKEVHLPAGYKRTVRLTEAVSLG